MALSFRQAFSAKERGEISWDTYVNVLLSRFTGINSDEEDDVQGTYPKLQRTDPFGHMIWMWSNRTSPITDTSALEAVFKACRYSSLEDVKSKLDLVGELPGKGNKELRTSLAMLACQERRADILKYVLDQGGFPIEGSMEEEAKSVDAKKDPDTFDALWQSRQFQEIKERDERNSSTRGAWQGAETRFDVGGRSPVDW